MYIRIHASGMVTLEEHEDFKRFHVEADKADITTDELSGALMNIADVVDASEVWIFETWLRGARADDRRFQESLSEMIDKARPHGWIDDTRKAIKAHLAQPETG